MAKPTVKENPRLERGTLATGLFAVLCVAGIVTLLTQAGPGDTAAAAPRHTTMDPETESRGSLVEMVPAALESAAALQLQKQGKPGGESKTVLRLR
jgi:hypothetical protein